MRLLLTLFLSILPFLAFSQNPEREKLDFKNNDKIIKKGEQSRADRDYMWENTAKDNRGFIHVMVPKEYIGLVDDALENPLSKSDIATKIKPISDALDSYGFTFLKILEEDSNRYNIVFRNAEGRLLMLTRWNYQVSGASFTRSEEFFNHKVQESPATLSLATSKNLTKGIWKLAWNMDGVSYELYLTENVDQYGLPQGTFEEIIKIADSIVEVDGKN